MLGPTGWTGPSPAKLCPAAEASECSPPPAPSGVGPGPGLDQGWPPSLGDPTLCGLARGCPRWSAGERGRLARAPQTSSPRPSVAPPDRQTWENKGPPAPLAPAQPAWSSLHPDTLQDHGIRRGPLRPSAFSLATPWFQGVASCPLGPEARPPAKQARSGGAGPHVSSQELFPRISTCSGAGCQWAARATYRCLGRAPRGWEGSAPGPVSAVWLLFARVSPTHRVRCVLWADARFSGACPGPARPLPSSHTRVCRGRGVTLWTVASGNCTSNPPNGPSDTPSWAWAVGRGVRLPCLATGRSRVRGPRGGGRMRPGPLTPTQGGQVPSGVGRRVRGSVGQVRTVAWSRGRPRWVRAPGPQLWVRGRCWGQLASGPAVRGPARQPRGDRHTGRTAGL